MHAYQEYNGWNQPLQLGLTLILLDTTYSSTDYNMLMRKEKQELQKLVLTYRESCNGRKAFEGNSSKSLCTWNCLLG